jgi:alpha-tubulin suppressor-like RCC1 family protein
MNAINPNSQKGDSMSKASHRVWPALGAALLSIGLLGCGGGGGGSGSSGGDGVIPPPPPPPPPPPAATAPIITTMPSAAVGIEGQTVTFSVAATGTAPLSYQWRRAGVAIPGATAATYTTPPLTLADNGVEFSVAVANATGSTNSSAALLTVSPLATSVAARLSAGPFNSAAVNAGGQVLIWGSNVAGLYAGGSALAGSGAVQLSLAARSVHVGLQGAVAVGRDGQVFGWGTSSVGALGDVGGSSLVATPRALPGLGGSQSAVFAEAMTLALKSDGNVWHLPGVATVGVGGTTVTASAVGGLSAVESLIRTGRASGFDLGTLAIKTDGSVWTLRYAVSALGTGFTYTVTPTQVAGLPPVKSAACAPTHCVFLLRDGRVFTRGENGDGQLGDGTRTASTISPVQALGLANIRAVAAVQRATVAVDSDGRVWTWGESTYHGRPDTGNDTLAPTLLPGVIGVVEVVAGTWHVLYLRNDGSVWGWGDNGNGELGDGTRDRRSEPVQSAGINLN